jgi:hypothetical protein
MLIERTSEMVFTCFAVQLGPPFVEHPRQYDVTSQLQSGTSWRALSEISRIHRIQSEGGWKEVNLWPFHLKRFPQVCENATQGLERRRHFDEVLNRNTIPLTTSSVFACLAFIVGLLNAAHEPQSFHGCCRNVFSGRV